MCGAIILTVPSIISYLCGVNKKNDISFDEFLDFFPVVELPVVLTEESIHSINKINKPLPGIAIQKFIKAWDPHIDDFEEFVPCLRFEVSKSIVAIVYWKATLLSYEYYLLTINNKVELLSKKIIAGLISNGTDIRRSAATIKEDLTIHIVAGDETGSYAAHESTPHYMEIMPEGSIVSYKEENKLWDQPERKK